MNILQPSTSEHLKVLIELPVDHVTKLKMLFSRLSCGECVEDASPYANWFDYHPVDFTDHRLIDKTDGNQWVDHCPFDFMGYDNNNKVINDIFNTSINLTEDCYVVICRRKLWDTTSLVVKIEDEDVKIEKYTNMCKLLSIEDMKKYVWICDMDKLILPSTTRYDDNAISKFQGGTGCIDDDDLRNIIMVHILSKTSNIHMLDEEALRAVGYFQGNFDEILKLLGYK